MAWTEASECQVKGDQSKTWWMMWRQEVMSQILLTVWNVQTWRSAPLICCGALNVSFFNPTDSGPQMVLLTSGVGESLLAETEMWPHPQTHKHTNNHFLWNCFTFFSFFVGLFGLFLCTALLWVVRSPDHLQPITCSAWFDVAPVHRLEQVSGGTKP